MMQGFVQQLVDLHACGQAIEWADKHTSAEAAWQQCARGDWMLWLCGKFSGSPESGGRKRLVACVCECARISLLIFERQFPKDNRIRDCLEVAERWSDGKATIAEVIKVRAAAAAYAAVYAAAAAYAADAAVYAADAAAYAAAAYAADAAVYAADAARAKVLLQCADIVRKHYPIHPTQGE